MAGFCFSGGTLTNTNFGSKNFLEEQNLNEFFKFILHFMNDFSIRIHWKDTDDPIANGKEVTGSPRPEVAKCKTSPLDTANQILAKGKVW